MFDEIKAKFQEVGIIPVVVLEDAKDAFALGEALVKGGLPAAYINGLWEAIENYRKYEGKSYLDSFWCGKYL